MVDRLTLTASGVDALARGVLNISSLPDPIGNIEDIRQQPSGIKVGKNEGASRCDWNDI